MEQELYSLTVHFIHVAVWRYHMWYWFEKDKFVRQIRIVNSCDRQT